MWKSALAVCVGSLILSLGISGCQTARFQTRDQIRGSSSGDIDPRVWRAVVGAAVERLHQRYYRAMLEVKEALRYQQSAELYYLLAENYYDLDQPQKALAALRQALALDSSFDPAWRLLGNLFISIGQFDSALAVYRHLYRKHPKHWGYGYALGRLYEYRSVDTAIALYERLLEREERQEVLVRLVKLYIRRQQYERAQKVLQRLLQNTPGSVAATTTAIELAVQQQRFNDAYQQLLDEEFFLSRKQFLSHLAYVGYHLLHTDSTTYENLVPRFLQLAEHYPDSWEVQYLSGMLALRVGKDTAGFAFFRRALQFHDTAAVRPLQVAFALADYRRYQWAIQILRQYWQHYAADVRFPVMIASYYLQLEQPDSALHYAQQGVQTDSASAMAWTQLGIVYGVLQQRELSDRAYQRALMLDSSDATAANNLAYSYAQQGIRLDTALQLAQRAVRLDSTNASFLDTIGWVYFKLRQYEKARQWLEKARRAGDASVVILEHLGDVYFQLGEYQKAYEVWRQALSLEPERETLQQRLEQVREKLKSTQADNK